MPQNQTSDESTPFVPQTGYPQLPDWLTKACRAAFPSDRWQVRGPFGPTEFGQHAYDLPLDDDGDDGVFVEDSSAEGTARVFLALTVDAAQLVELLQSLRSVIIRHQPEMLLDAGVPLCSSINAPPGIPGICRTAMVEGSFRACSLPKGHDGAHHSADGFAWLDIDEDEDGALPRTGCASQGEDAHVADSPAEHGEHLLTPAPPLSAMPAWDEDAWVRVTFTPGAYRWNGATSHIGGLSAPVIYRGSVLSIRAPGDDAFRPVQAWTFVGVWLDGAAHEWICDIDDELESIAPETEIDGVVEIIPRTDVVRIGSPNHASRRQHV